MLTTADELVAAEDACGESPLWDPAAARLHWVDVGRRRIHELDAATGHSTTRSIEVPVSAIALGDPGELVVGGERGLWILGDAGVRPLPLVASPAAPCINDLRAGPQGRLYFGTFRWDGARMLRHGHVVLRAPDGRLTVLDDGYELANGMGFSPDGGTFYATDSTRRTVFAYDVGRDGTLTRRRTFATVAVDDGLPDGLTVDAEGFVWSACWYGGCVIAWDPEGREATRVRVPAAQTSSVAFGGAALDTLYVTTASEPWPSPYVPPGLDLARVGGGSLYRARVPARGRPEHRIGTKEPS